MHFIFVPPSFFILIGSIPADGDTSSLVTESTTAAMGSPDEAHLPPVLIATQPTTERP